ncbi:hypothetical protein BDZ91DRAFT_762893 [Kalaharituber pfeilii]|nr:hypothetical protein BDZ91DRAFT_762893 [Kalaharituber pfeilii]
MAQQKEKYRQMVQALDLYRAFGKFCDEVFHAGSDFINEGYIILYLRSKLDEGNQFQTVVNNFAELRMFCRKRYKAVFPSDKKKRIDNYMELCKGSRIKEYDMAAGTITSSSRPLPTSIQNLKAKLLLDASDLVNLLTFHWIQSTIQYPIPRYRVQLPLIMQILAYTRSRPGAVIESSVSRAYPEMLGIST